MAPDGYAKLDISWIVREIKFAVMFQMIRFTIGVGSTVEPQESLKFMRSLQHLP
jgi:hypothetical protein